MPKVQELANQKFEKSLQSLKEFYYESLISLIENPHIPYRLYNRTSISDLEMFGKEIDIRNEIHLFLKDKVEDYDEYFQIETNGRSLGVTRIKKTND